MTNDQQLGSKNASSPNFLQSWLFSNLNFAFLLPRAAIEPYHVGQVYNLPTVRMLQERWHYRVASPLVPETRLARQNENECGSPCKVLLASCSLFPILGEVDFETSFCAVRERVQAACGRASRDPASVTLLAVSKNQPPEVVRGAAELGQTLFGESRVQEAKAKIELCPGRLHWHMIGHLQTNKCRDAVQLFEMIQSVDSLKLAQEIDKWAGQIGKTMPVLLEVNIAGAATKFGFKPDQVLDQLEALNRLPKLELHGLMTIAPWTPEPEKVRPIFCQLRELKLACEQKLGAPLPHLSMGMSTDFEIAIEEGATLIRLGTVLFGSRPKVKISL